MADLILSTIWFERQDNKLVRHNPGDAVDVEQDVADWLIRSGAAAYDDGNTDDVQEPEVGGETDDADSEDATADPEPSQDESERPVNAANKATWEAYAKSKGVDTKGMSRDEIIAAVG